MKVKFGAIITDGRNKIGGHVLSKNRGGAYMRTKVTPSNPRTDFQNAVRAALTEFSQGWRGLSASAIAAWNSAVSSFASTDIFGDLKNPSGLNLYVKLNANLSEVGASPIGLPPLPASVIGPETITLTATAGTPALSVAWTGGAIGADYNWIVRATPQVSPGKSFVKNLFRNIQVLPAADTTPTAILANYVARFGALIEGEKISVEIVPVNIVTGQKGTPISSTVIVGA